MNERRKKRRNQPMKKEKRPANNVAYLHPLVCCFLRRLKIPPACATPIHCVRLGCFNLLAGCWAAFGCAEQSSCSAGQKQPVRRAYLSRAYSKTAISMSPAATVHCCKEQPGYCTAASGCPDPAESSYKQLKMYQPNTVIKDTNRKLFPNNKMFDAHTISTTRVT